MKKIVILLGLVTMLGVGCSAQNAGQEVGTTIGEQTDDKKADKGSEQQTEKKPEKIVEETFDAIKKSDMDKLANILNGEASSKVIENEAFLNLVKASHETLNYKIVDTVIEGDHATVTVDCTYGDVKGIFGTAFKEYFQNAMQFAFSGVEATQEELDEILSTAIINALETTSPEEYAATIQVPCVKIDKRWAIDNSSENLELSDAMTGNLVSTLQEMTEAMKQE